MGGAANRTPPGQNAVELIPPAWNFSRFTDTWSAFPFAQWFINSWVIAVVAVVFMLFQRYFVADIATTGVK
jgi:ABC-type glycerol-3-phosphate transport system permease component